MKNQEFEFIGSLNPAIAKLWNLEEHANKPIIVYENVIQHVIDRHLNHFESIEEIDYIWSKLRSIIKHPDNVFYNSTTKGLEYYKKMGKEIVVAVRINFGTTLKVRSFYPANKGKLKNRRLKEQQKIESGEINDYFDILPK